MSDLNRTDLCRAAYRLAFVRLGLCAPGPARGEPFVPPCVALASMDPGAARKAKRRWRKLWRVSLKRELRFYEALPRRTRKGYYAGGSLVNGKWRSSRDVLEGCFFNMRSCDVGRHPRFGARIARALKVCFGKELQKAISVAMKDLGLMPDWGRKRGG